MGAGEDSGVRRERTAPSGMAMPQSSRYIFDPGRMALLDMPERAALQDRAAFAALFPTGPGVYVDIGAGTGYFTFPAGTLDGGAWRIIALDLQERMCRELLDRVRRSGAGNIGIVRTGDAVLPVKDSTAHIVNLGNAYHEIDDRAAFLSEVRRILAPGGRFLLIDWEARESPMGPPLHERVPAAVARGELLRAGFSTVTSHPIYSHHYVLDAVN